MFSPLSIGAVIFSYLIGNISPAILIGKMAGVEIRSQGSGNAGTTNVLRVLGKKAAVATLLIDILKGVAAVLIGRYLGGQSLAMVCGLAAFLGHIWPAVFGFRGGKGIATAAGIILTVEPLMGLIEAAIALSLIAATRWVSLGSLTAALLLPVVAYFFDPKYTLWAAVMAVIVFIKHRANLKRLLRGEESKISFKKREEQG